MLLLLMSWFLKFYFLNWGFPNITKKNSVLQFPSDWSRFTQHLPQGTNFLINLSIYCCHSKSERKNLDTCILHVLSYYYYVLRAQFLKKCSCFLRGNVFVNNTNPVTYPYLNQQGYIMTMEHIQKVKMSIFKSYSSMI